MAWVTVLAPYLRASSWIRLSPAFIEATPAQRSPRAVSGMRMLAMTMSITEGMGLPLSNSLISGSCRPSWKTSVALGLMLLGAMPPTSAQCALFATQAMSSSAAKTGRIRATSFMWLTPPRWGMLAAKMSPGWMSPAENFSMMARTP